MDWRWHKRWNAFWVREEQKAKQAIDRLDLENWCFDHWHTHVDWKSRGVRCHQQRRNVAEATYKLLIYVESVVAQRRKADDIQVFGLLCTDTGSNAVYLHIRNPNSSVYPFAYEDITWLDKDIPGLEGIVNLQIHEVGFLVSEDGADYYLRRRTKQ